MNWENEYNYALFKYNVYDDCYYFLPVNELPSTGFSSLYSITRTDSEALEKAGFSSFKGVCWSKELWIDTDTEYGATQTRGRLAALGLAFKEYTTGNRGAHFAIPRPHAPSHLLPKIDKEWVLGNLASYVNLSIYTHLHMFRNIGTVHEKTGERKALVREIGGQVLVLPDGITVNTVSELYKGPEGSGSIFTDEWALAMTVPIEDGERHSRLLNLGIYLKKSGEPVEFISRWLYHTNLLCDEPLEEQELESIIDFVARAD